MLLRALTEYQYVVKVDQQKLPNMLSEYVGKFLLVYLFIAALKVAGALVNPKLSTLKW